MDRGTFECPICEFDKPHSHVPSEIANRGKHNENQRTLMRERASEQYLISTLKEEFELNPRAYVNRYGTINSTESAFLVQWLLARLDRLEGEKK